MPFNFSIFYSPFQPSAFSLGDLHVPQMANVLKVFLENGQTKSFKYDSTTTVRVSNSFFLQFFSFFVQQFNKCVFLFIRNTVCTRTLIHMFLLYAVKYEQILRYLYIVNRLRCLVVHFGLLLFTTLGKARVVRWIEKRKLDSFRLETLMKT